MSRDPIDELVDWQLRDSPRNEIWCQNCSFVKLTGTCLTPDSPLCPKERTA